MDIILFCIFLATGLFMYFQESKVVDIYTLNVYLTRTPGWDLEIEKIYSVDVMWGIIALMYTVALSRALSYFGMKNFYVEACFTLPIMIVCLAILNEVREINILVILFLIVTSTLYYFMIQTNENRLSSTKYTLYVLWAIYFYLLVFTAVLGLRVAETERWGDILEFKMDVKTYFYGGGGDLWVGLESFNLLIPFIVGVGMIILNQLLIRCVSVDEISYTSLQLIVQIATIILACMVIGLREWLIICTIVLLYWSYASLSLIPPDDTVPHIFGYGPIFIIELALSLQCYMSNNLVYMSVIILLCICTVLHLILQTEGNVVHYTLLATYLFFAWITFANL